MVFGMTTYTFVHVVLSLIGIGSGLVVVIGLFASKRLEAWTAVFLTTTVATSVTGFGFPFVTFSRRMESASYRSSCWRSRSSRATANTLRDLGAGPTRPEPSSRST